jgi:tetratricopeptide (TPR) repeat protein
MHPLGRAVLCLFLLCQSLGAQQRVAQRSTCRPSDTSVAVNWTACRGQLARDSADYYARVVVIAEAIGANHNDEALELARSGRRFHPDSVGLITLEADLRRRTMQPAELASRMLSPALTQLDSARILFGISLAFSGDTSTALLDQVIALAPRYRPALQKRIRDARSELRLRQRSHAVRQAWAEQAAALASAEDYAWEGSDYLDAAEIADSLGMTETAITILKLGSARAASTRMGSGKWSWSPRLEIASRLAERLQARGREAEAVPIARNALTWPDDQYTELDWARVASLATVLWNAGWNSLAREAAFRIWEQQPGEGGLLLLTWSDQDTLPSYHPWSRLNLWRSFGARFPKHCLGPLEIGLALIAERRVEEGRRSVYHAVQCAPGWSRAWANYGHVLSLQYRHAEAVRAWERALLLDPKVFDTNGMAAEFERSLRIAGPQPPMALPADGPGGESGNQQARKRRESRAEATASLTSGSAVVVSRDGHLITNAHVVKGCRDIRVYIGGRPVPASLAAADPANDLALLSAGRLPLEVAVLRSSPVRTGEVSVVAGYPLRGLLADQLNITTGNISSLAGPGSDSRLLQITNTIAPGNSGGPLFDESGMVIGIVSSKLDALRAYRYSGDLATNIGFAINVAMVRTFLETNDVTPEWRSMGPIRRTVDIAGVARQVTVPVECRF